MNHKRKAKQAAIATFALLSLTFVPAQAYASELTVLPEFQNTAMNAVSSRVNVRESATTDSPILAQVSFEDIVSVTGYRTNGEVTTGSDNAVWYLITTGDGVSGYVKSDFFITNEDVQDYFLDAGSLYAITPDEDVVYGVFFDEAVDREEVAIEGEESNVELCSGTSYTITDVREDGVVVDVDGANVLVDANAVEISIVPALDKLRSEIVEYACQFVGNPYVWGGTSLTNGADCSGFVMRIYEQFGYSLPRVSADQANAGTRISVEDIQPGDLVFYGNPVFHVAMYIGNGQIVHAANSRAGIVIGDLNSPGTPTSAITLLG